MEFTLDERRLFDHGSKFPEGINEENIISSFPQWSITDIAALINSLSSKGIIQFHKQGKTLFYKFLNSTEIDMYSIKKKLPIIPSNHRGIKVLASFYIGIWIKDLKFKTNLHQNLLIKILKFLEGKKLIKSIKSVKNATKKVYMLFDVEPSVEVTGGPWFSDNELDSEFIDGLCKASFKLIASKSISKDPSIVFSSSYKGFATLEEVHSFIINSGMSNVELSIEDISNILDTLIFAGRIEKIFSDITKEGDHDVFYRAIVPFSLKNPLSSVPCFTCPVS